MRVSFKYDIGDKVFVVRENRIVSGVIGEQTRMRTPSEGITVFYMVKTDVKGGSYKQHNENLISRSVEGLGARLAKMAKQ